MSTRFDKVPPPLRPEVAERAWSARESGRVFAIMADFVEAPSASGLGPFALQSGHCTGACDPFIDCFGVPARAGSRIALLSGIPVDTGGNIENRDA